MTALLLVLLLSAGASCGGGKEAEAPRTAADTSAGGGAGRASTFAEEAPAEQNQEAAYRQVSLAQTEAAQQEQARSERRIIRNASLTIEVDSPSQALPRVTSLAESLGGYVVSSESRQQGGTGDTRPYETVTVVMRVPASGFDAALVQLRSLGVRVADEKTTGQDVTEEYIDLEARLRTQRALEAQFLEIMKETDTVAEALQVQRELANVRTEIERVEGRRRYLENQVSFSTITVTLAPPAALVTASGFFSGLKDAFGDGLNAAVVVTLGLIRVVIALLPLLLLVVLPVVLLVRRFRRRRQRPSVAE
jgi:hypothetical protein